MNSDLIDTIAATIRCVDDDHTTEARAMAEAIVEDVAELATNPEVLDRAVAALKEDGWAHTHEGPNGIGDLSDEDLANIAQAVIRSLTGTV